MPKTTDERSIEIHEKFRGKLSVEILPSLESVDDLSLAYTPGVAAACREIAADSKRADDLTWRRRVVAVVTDGTAVLGLGDIGPLAGLPVMEGKCALFKKFGGVDAVPILIDSKDPEEIISTVEKIAVGFGGINLEDISAPRCFEIERRLTESLRIPVFHDDQHGTAIVVLAALKNALRVVGKEISKIKIVINGAGAAGLAIVQILIDAGADPANLIVVDSRGAIFVGRDGLNTEKMAIAERTNAKNLAGNLAEVAVDADVLIGVSVAGAFTPKIVSAMAERAIVFAMANPTPEIFPDVARSAGATVVATGRSDFPNQVNNVLVFPGLFRGALAKKIEKLDRASFVRIADALAALISDPTAEKIIPNPFDPRAADAVADAV